MNPWVLFKVVEAASAPFLCAEQSFHILKEQHLPQS